MKNKKMKKSRLMTNEQMFTDFKDWYLEGLSGDMEMGTLRDHKSLIEAIRNLASEEELEQLKEEIHHYYRVYHAKTWDDIMERMEGNWPETLIGYIDFLTDELAHERTLRR